jgi:hypothetical protein
MLQVAACFSILHDLVCVEEEKSLTAGILTAIKMILNILKDESKRSVRGIAPAPVTNNKAFILP